MCSETEAKLRVSSLSEIEGKVKELDGEFAGEYRQVDSYFDDGEGRLFSQDKGLRIRKEVDNKSGGEKNFLTWKGAKKTGEYKTREEIELRIGSDRDMAKILTALGYENRLKVSKVRRLWRIEGCSLCLDKVDGLGEFVEIECDNSRIIAELQKKLGLGQLKHIEKTYAEMVGK